MAKEIYYTHETESEDRGLFDFIGKKGKDDVVMVNQFEKVHISGEASDEDKEEKPSHLQKLHRSNSSSSSSSSDEEADKKKRELKEKINKMNPGDKEKDDTTIPIEWIGDRDGKKGFPEKINGKLPGDQPKKAAKDSAVEHGESKGLEGEASREKKGILEKIKEKLSGYYNSGGEENGSH